MVTKVNIKELESGSLKIKGLELTVGRFVESEDWAEPIGPTPYPGIMDLRDWDLRLLTRYKPFYSPLSDFCEFCTFGKCDLTAGKRGACGIDMYGHMGKWSLLQSVMGASAHTTHAHHLLHYLIKQYGGDKPIDLGSEVEIEAPITRLITGIRPKKLSDLIDVINYIEGQITHLLSATATGQEQNYLDYESKALHAGMLDILALEVADIAQISALGFPKGDSETPFIEVGMGVIERKKPVILCIGHNVAPGSEVINYLYEAGLYGQVEVAGICCTASDLARFSKGAKIVGPISRQLRFIRMGVADVVIVDQECVRADVIEEAVKVGSRVIATSDQLVGGLPNFTWLDEDIIVSKLTSGEAQAIVVQDLVKVGRVAVKAAQLIAPLRAGQKGYVRDRVLAKASVCSLCLSCTKNCPIGINVGLAVDTAKRGDQSLLLEVFDECLGCGRCDSACPNDIPVLTVVDAAAEDKIRNERFKIRAGRGPIKDTEIRNVGRPIVMGEIPGVVVFAGCANYPGGNNDLAAMAEEFVKRRYIVLASGCAALDIARYKDENGMTLYEKYPGDFDAGCIVNLGPCVSNAHAVGAVVKIASIFAKRNLRGNFEEIADYILNRIGAVAIAWGSQHQKAMSIATGANRFGIPVILGPQGVKHRRAYLGRSDDHDSWLVYNAKDGRLVYAGPTPEHLLCVVETTEEAMVTAAKLVMRPNDTPKGRMIKISNYVSLHRQFYNCLPDDLHLFVRDENDLPVTMKDEILRLIKQRGWRPVEIPDPTILSRLAVGGR